ncbi:hypothetical protein HYS93_02350 [Candidatus Daviesbacteria bacterium]|nr:hypothetical protein [Candidatus Daviesbacteria bacterium]
MAAETPIHILTSTAQEVEWLSSKTDGKAEIPPNIGLRLLSALTGGLTFMGANTLSIRQAEKLLNSQDLTTQTYITFGMALGGLAIGWMIEPVAEDIWREFKPIRTWMGRQIRKAVSPLGRIIPRINLTGEPAIPPLIGSNSFKKVA